jgi:membrane fusion protein (multidrug efflux system)
MSDEPRSTESTSVTPAPKLAGENGRTWRDFQVWQRQTRQRSRTRVAVLGAVALLLIGAIAYGAYLWHYGTIHVSTDDAFIYGHIAPVSARVAGTVIEVLIRDNQDVKAGEVLVKLDRRDPEVALAQAEASVATARAELQNAVVNVPLTDRSTLSLLQEAGASLAAVSHASQATEHDLEQKRNDAAAKQAAASAAEAALQAAQSDFDRAKLDRDRSTELFAKQLVSRQDVDHTEAAYRNSQAMLEQARHKVTQAREDARQSAAGVRSQEAAVAQGRERISQSRATVANAESQRQQVAMREAQVAAARSRLELALANLRQAQLNLEYTLIKAPLTGRVTKRTVEPGQVVAVGQPLLSVVNLDNVWVLANYKETQLTHVRPGQRVSLHVDMYPGKEFKGKVDSIQGGSGAVFSLLPPENATGNYVKVVQRIPVKIVLEPGQNADHVLVPGMSVVPTIALR